MSGECRSATMKDMNRMAADYRLNYRLAHACEGAAVRRPGAAVPAGEIRQHHLAGLPGGGERLPHAVEQQQQQQLVVKSL